MDNTDLTFLSFFLSFCFSFLSWFLLCFLCFSFLFSCTLYCLKSYHQSLKWTLTFCASCSSFQEILTASMTWKPSGSLVGGWGSSWHLILNRPTVIAMPSLRSGLVPPHWRSQGGMRVRLRVSLRNMAVPVYVRARPWPQQGNGLE